MALENMALHDNGIPYGDTTFVHPIGTPKATIVWLHDIGENGEYSARFVRQLGLRDITWICPTAPTRPVSRLGGAVTTAWFDVNQASDNMPNNALASLNSTCAHVANLFANESVHVKKGVGGIGLGAAAALYFGSNCVPQGVNSMRLHAVVAINGWLPTRSNFQLHINSGTVDRQLAALLPILLTNEDNDMVPHAFRDLCRQTLIHAGFPITPATNWWDPIVAGIWLKNHLQLWG